MTDKKSATVIATTTFVKDDSEVRARLALETIRGLVKLYPVVVVDGGSPKEFRQKIVDCGAVLLDEVPGGMGAGRRQAMHSASEIASEGGAVVWMEPEKLSLVSSIEKIVDPILSRKADLVIPRRISMRSYPQEQIYAEWLGNKIFNGIVGRGSNYDIWFGPFAANKKALRHFLDYNGMYGDRWDSILIPRLEIIKDGLVVSDVPVEYSHPSEQTKEEEGDMMFMHKRIIQLSSLVDAFIKEGKRLKMQ